MSKILSFLRESNRIKHLLGGFLVALFAFGAIQAVYASIVAASCLEFKDRLWGGKWDWIDWAFTVFGGVVASIIYLF